MRGQLYRKRFIAYDNCQRHIAADVGSPLTTTEVSDGVLFTIILVPRGRVTGRNLSRYCPSSERTTARQFRKTFEWPDFHHWVMVAALDPRSELISVQDASFMAKSGK